MSYIEWVSVGSDIIILFTFLVLVYTTSKNLTEKRKRTIILTSANIESYFNDMNDFCQYLTNTHDVYRDATIFYTCQKLINKTHSIAIGIGKKAYDRQIIGYYKESSEVIGAVLRHNLHRLEAVRDLNLEIDGTFKKDNINALTVLINKYAVLKKAITTICLFITKIEAE